MENSLSRSYSGLRFKNEPNQGCIWGIFHMLHVYHRHNVKKERSKAHRGRRRYGGPKYSKLIENTFDAADGEALIKEQTEDLQTEEDRLSAIPSLDESDKTFRENMSAEENKHQFPSLHSQFHRLYSIHHLEPSHPHLPDEVREGNGETTKIDNHQGDCPRVTNMSKLDESAASHNRCELNDNPSSMKSLRYDELNELGRELLDEALLQDKVQKSKEASLQHNIFNSKENNKGSTFDKPKEFMNSLDVLNVNHSFLKSLEDPNYSLAHHMQAVRDSKGTRGLTKSESYHGSNSSRRMDIEHEELVENRVHARHEGRVKSGNLQPLSTQTPPFEDNASSIREAETLSYEAHETDASSFQGSFDQLKEQGENQAGKKRFKNIRHIIKYAINESKKSRRISLDAILHKIPYGRSFSKNSKMDTNDQWKGRLSDNDREDSPSAKYENDDAVSTPTKGGHRRMRRAHSLNASLERYSELFKSRISHDMNSGPSDKLLLSQSPKPLGRICSLPNIDIHAIIQSEAPLHAHLKGTSITSPSERGTDIERSIFANKKIWLF
ncbi:hypothetical protein Syun_002631 [Stephania yunnanensis]|uniref:Uncharacterized protein n=1 Tax=Stephania yunnanensis TaxID=152371 RepID=A0AAP0LG47_9MAGN